MHNAARTLAVLVRHGRKAHELSQQALADKLGIDVRTIIDIEKERGNPKFQLLFPLVRLLELPADLLFYPERGVSEANLNKAAMHAQIDELSDHQIEHIYPAFLELITLVKRNEQ